MAERPKAINIAGSIDPSIGFELKTETQEERESRLRREEARLQHEHQIKEAENAHKHQISFWGHIFVMAIVGVAFLASIGIAVLGDPKTGLPDKAMGIIVAIAAAGMGYITGKGSQ